MTDALTAQTAATPAAPVEVRFDARDIGFAIRDFLEDKTIHRFEDGADAEGDVIEIDETDDTEEVAFVDAGDLNNLIVHLANGQIFTVRIIAGER